MSDGSEKWSNWWAIHSQTIDLTSDQSYKRPTRQVADLISEQPCEQPTWGATNLTSHRTDRRNPLISQKMTAPKIVNQLWKIFFSNVAFWSRLLSRRRNTNMSRQCGPLTNKTDRALWVSLSGYSCNYSVCLIEISTSIRHLGCQLNVEKKCQVLKF